MLSTVVGLQLWVSWRTLKLTAVVPYSLFLPGTSGSDSPGQAVEAEEIVKQLDMEQVEEIPASTATSTEGAVFSNQTVPLTSTTDDASEEGEIASDADLPPLTGLEHV